MKSHSFIRRTFAYLTRQVRCAIVLIFIIIWIDTYSQCNVSASPDITICRGANTQLTASAPFAISYQWSPATGLNAPYLQSPFAYPLVTTAYVVTSYTVLDTNLIVNGDFELGNTGFNSAYTYNSVSVWNEATYAVNINPTNVHPNFASCDDHTTSIGQMMIVNGAAAPNTNVWCKTVTVNPNTDYAFSTWLASTISASPAILQFSINNVVLGAPFGASATLCVWQQFYEIWNSGPSTSATICIVNQNTAQSGNDFLLDDISFQPFCSATDTVLVIIDSVPADAGPDTLVCKGTKATLNGKGGVSYHWSTGANTQQLNVTLTSPATFTVTVTNSQGCQGEDSVHVGILPLPLADAGPHLEMCLGDTTMLTASGGVTYAWSNNVNSHTQMVSPVFSTIYHVLVSDTNHCSALDSITVFVRPNPQPDLGPEVVVCPGDTVSLTVNETGTYEWNTGQTGASISFVYQQDAPYWVEVTNEYNCMTTDTVLVKMKPDGCFFEIPNVFTPNGDGRNDVFFIDYKGLEDYNLKIYNRWGKKVFESVNKENFWDGSISNQPASDGVYYYGLIIGERKYKGTVTVFGK